MILRRRYMIMILVIAMMLSVFIVPTGYAQKDTLEQDNAVQLAERLGLMPASQEEYMTRSDLAEVLYNIVSYNVDKEKELEAQWSSTFFGDRESMGENSNIDVPVVSRFQDVPENHAAYEAIMRVAELGLMRGTSLNEFEPDEPLPYTHAVKAVLDLLGYKPQAALHGGFPGGYIMIANQLRLLKGISSSETMSRGELAQLIKNALNIELLTGVSYGEANTYETRKEKTLLTEILLLEEKRGMLEDNGITTLYGESDLAADEAVIDGVLFHISEETEYIRSWMGREIICYYQNEDNRYPGRIVYAELSGNDKIQSISAEALDGFSNGTLSYTENNRSKKVSLSSGYVLLYNGLAMEVYEDSVFDISAGEISIITPQKTAVPQIVIVNAYESWYVDAVDTENDRIYNKIAVSGKENRILSLEEYGSTPRVTLELPDGRAAKISDIKAGDVLDVARNGAVIHAKIVRNVVDSFTVDSIREGHLEKIMSGVGGNYAVSREYFEYSEGKLPSPGTEVTLTLNSFGKVAYLSEQTDNRLRVGYLIALAGTDSAFDSETRAKIMDMDRKISVLDFADKVKVSGFDAEEAIAKEEAVFKTYADYVGFIRYTLNADDEINYIEFPVLDAGKSVDKLRLILHSTEETKNTVGYHKAGIIGGKALINANTKIVKVNPYLSGDEAYSTMSYATIEADQSYLLKLYSVSEGSPVAQYAECVSEAQAGLSVSFREYAVIKEISKGLNDDGEIMTQLSVGYASAQASAVQTDMTLYVLDEAMADLKDTMGNPYPEELEKGDIIRYSQNAQEYVDEIRVLWNQNGNNPAFPQGTKGHLCGTVGYYGTDEQYKTNPFAFQTDTKLYDAYRFSSGSMRVLYGFAQSVRDGAFAISVFDLPSRLVNPNTEKYLEEYWMPNRKLMIVTLNNSRETVEIKTGLVSDIRTYEKFGADCSRIIHMTRFGHVDCTIVVNGYLD